MTFTISAGPVKHNPLSARLQKYFVSDQHTYIVQATNRCRSPSPRAHPIHWPIPLMYIFPMIVSSGTPD